MDQEEKSLLELRLTFEIMGEDILHPSDRPAHIRLRVIASLEPDPRQSEKT